MVVRGVSRVLGRGFVRALLMGVIGHAGVAHAAGLDDIERASRNARDAMSGVSGRMSLVRTSKRDPEFMSRGFDAILARPDTSAGMRKAVGDLKRNTPALSETNEEIDHTFDSGSGWRRAEVRDLRDLSAIMGQGATRLEQARIAMLSRTGVYLQNRRSAAGVFWAEQNDAARALTLEFVGPGAGTTFAPPLDAGIASASRLSLLRGGPLVIETFRENGRELTRITSTAPGTRVRCRAVFDPSIGQRLRMFEMRDAEGRLTERVTADDYRSVSAIAYPFLQTEEQWDPSSGRCILTTTTRVLSAEFNLRLTEADFVLVAPLGTYVSVILGDHRVVRCKAEREQTMSLAELESIALGVEDVAGKMGKDASQQVLTAVAVEKWATYGRQRGSGSDRPLSPLTRPSRGGTTRIELPASRPASRPAAQPGAGAAR
jgi:hypothetical protein